MAKRGRPTIASQSVDEALSRYYSGELPKRPRNEIERQVMEGKRGRRRNPNSPSQSAVQFAGYLIKNEGKGEREASREAASAYQLHPDTVRKALRVAMREPTVDVVVAQNPMFRQLAPDQIVSVPFIPDIDDLPDEWQADMR